MLRKMKLMLLFFVARFSSIFNGLFCLYGRVQPILILFCPLYSFLLVLLLIQKPHKSVLNSSSTFYNAKPLRINFVIIYCCAITQFPSVSSKIEWDRTREWFVYMNLVQLSLVPSNFSVYVHSSFSLYLCHLRLNARKQDICAMACKHTKCLFKRSKSKSNVSVCILFHSQIYLCLFICVHTSGGLRVFGAMLQNIFWSFPSWRHFQCKLESKIEDKKKKNHQFLFANP